MTAIVKKNALPVSGFCLFVITRIGYLLLYKGVSDPYGYFEKAMIRTNDQSVSLTSSGIAFAYTGYLSKLFLFVGNRMDAVPIFHCALQTVAFVFLVGGVALLFGRGAGYICGFGMTLLPYPIMSIGHISPDNYLLFYVSILFFLIAVFYKVTRNDSWQHNIKVKIYLILLGFLIGKICIWHGTGFLGALVLVAVLWTNRLSVKLLLWQMFILATGIFFGGYATLMKYTGVTGNILSKQFGWWVEQLTRLEGDVWQDVSIFFLVSVGGVILMSGLFGSLGKKKQAESEKECIQENTDVKEDVAKTSDREETTQINYIENPLPLPKKHVKKVMNFDFEEERDDFDIQIDENDDFDV